MSLARPRKRGKAAVGTQPRATTRASQPPLVWGRWRVTPPKTVKMSRAAIAPTRRMAVPVVRSCRVSRCIGDETVRAESAVGCEHGVDDDSADGDVEPDGEGPAG